MTGAPWEVTLEVAGHSWTVTNLDPATLGPTAPLTIRHALPDDQLWPSQPLPMAATFGLVAATAAEVDDVVQGAHAWVSFTASPNPDPVTFAGTVADVEVEPATFTPAPGAGPVAGVRVTVTAIGYLAQLMEEPITLAEDDFGSITFADDRLFNLFGASPWEVPEWPDAGPEWFDSGNFFGEHKAMMKALAVQGESMGPHLDRLLRLWLWQLTANATVQRLVVEPIIDPVTHQLGEDRGSYTAYWQTRWVGGGVALPPTAELADTPDGWAVVAAGTISAHRIDRGVRYVQRKRSNVSRVVVPYFQQSVAMKPTTTSQSNGNKPTVLATIDSDLALASDEEGTADTIASFYLPAGGADAWGVDTVVWELAYDEPGRTPPALGELVVIAPVPESQNPNGKGWVTGLVRSWTLTLPDASVELELVTAYGVATAETAGDRMTWAEVPATPTWDDLRATDTWADYDHLRGP